MGTARVQSVPVQLRYVLAHGANEGLVERSAEWPGLTCLPQLQGPARRLFLWFNWTKRWSKRESEDMAVEVVPLPCWNELGEEERQRAVRGLLEEVEAEARSRNKPVLGVHAVRAQSPHTRPEHLNRSPAASGACLLRELREQYRSFVAAFREAEARWRRGDFSACFPLSSFPPSVAPGRAARVL